jgi:hypothetical protein
VAGIIALWLQAKPDLTREEIIDAFSHTCRQPDAALPYPNNEYGYGEIDAYRGLLHLLGIDGIKDISHHQPRQADIRLQGRTLHISGATCGTLSVYDLRGRLLQHEMLTENTAIDLSALPSGVYAVQTTTDTPATTGSTLIKL